MRNRKQLQIENLEDRWCPALTANLSAAGVLTIAGTADSGTINVAQDAKTAGMISVQDGTNAVGSGAFAGVTSIKLNLTEANDVVNLDLGGQTFAGNVAANLGGGADSLSVSNGQISGELEVEAVGAVFGGRGCGRGPAGRGATADTGLDTVSLAAGTTVGRLEVEAGQAGATINVDGDVTGNVEIEAKQKGSTGGIVANLNGTIDGNVRFRGSEQADTLAIRGDVGGSVWAALFGGADSVSINGAVTNRLELDTGAGDDVIQLNSVVGGRTHIDAGAGNDALSIGATAQLLSSASINLGAGNDSMTLDDAAVIATLLANGGTGTDTFTGTSTRAGLILRSF